MEPMAIETPTSNQTLTRDRIHRVCEGLMQPKGEDVDWSRAREWSCLAKDKAVYLGVSCGSRFTEVIV
jgi:hypothetical protein